jgi:hypothetical protein
MEAKKVHDLHLQAREPAKPVFKAKFKELENH